MERPRDKLVPAITYNRAAIKSCSIIKHLRHLPKMVNKKCIQHYCQRCCCRKSHFKITTPSDPSDLRIHLLCDITRYWYFHLISQRALRMCRLSMRPVLFLNKTLWISPFPARAGIHYWCCFCNTEIPYRRQTLCISYFLVPFQFAHRHMHCDIRLPFSRQDHLHCCKRFTRVSARSPTRVQWLWHLLY